MAVVSRACASCLSGGGALRASLLSAAHAAPGGHQAAVPVSAPAGRRHDQHPLASLQPLPVPDLRPRHERHPRTAHQVGPADDSKSQRTLPHPSLSVPSSPNICGRKRKHEEDERQSVPNILQGEVARLDVKFLVNLDPSQCSNNGTVHLICKLGQRRLHVLPWPPGGSVTDAAVSFQTTGTSRAFLRCS